jgi:WD40 repeat protein
MKKIISSLLIGSSLLCAANLYHKELHNDSLPLTFKISTQNNITSIDIKNDKILVSTAYKVKIYNLKTKELEKTLAFDNIRKARYSNDSSKIFILTKKKLYIYDNNYKEISHIKGNNFKTFNISNDDKFLAVYDYQNDNTDIYNLITGDKIAKIHKYYIRNIKFSPKNKIALITSSKVFIYNTHGDLITTLPKLSETIRKIVWVDDDTIDILATTYSNQAYLYRFDVKTSQIITQTPNKKYLDSFVNLDKNNDLLANNNILTIFNFKTKKFLKKFVDSTEKNKDVVAMELSDNHQTLAVGYSDENIKIYKTNFTKIDTPITIPTTTKQPKPQIKEKVVTKIKVVEKKVYVQNKTNKKPTVEIYASQTDGIVPLTVSFKIIANDEDGKIVSYYINFAGEEVLGKGNPTKPFNYTFTKPGKYQIMVAVKDNNGAIATKKITIKTREESFEDFKKNIIGK